MLKPWGPLFSWRSPVDTIFKVGGLVPPSLLVLLTDLFPNKCPSLDTPERQVWFLAGQASVVEYLKEAHLLASNS